jgi:hypothetical protein
MFFFFIVRLLPSYFAAAPLQTAHTLCHQGNLDGSKKGELHKIKLENGHLREFSNR